MNVYIDKSNLLSLIHSRSDNLYADSVKLLKKQLNIFFNFSKDDLKQDEVLMAWFATFTQGVGINNTFEFNTTFPERPLKSNTYKSFDAEGLSSVYLLEDEKCDSLKSSGTILIGKVGEEIDVLGKLFLNQKDYLFEKKWRIGSKLFSKWNDLTSYSLPLTDIIIVDQYILKNKDTDTDTLDTNLIEYLFVLTHSVNSKINIVIITHPDNIDYDFNTLRSKINTKVKSSTRAKPNITLIKTRKEHDRTILTNYNRIYSGDTFNFWNNQGKKITKGKEIAYSSIAKSENHFLAKELISDIQKTINWNYKNNPEYIEGDKQSGYLKFE